MMRFVSAMLSAGWPTMLTSLVLMSAGCDKSSADKETRPAPGQRVNAVVAKPSQADPAEACDVYPNTDSAAAFEWPALTAAPPPKPGSGWRWINLWATWCKPCIEEMPLLRQWQKRLKKAGVQVDLVFVSGDDSDEIVSAFRQKHPGLPPSARVADPEALAEWFEGLGVPGASLPVHVFVDAENKVRCVRASAVSENDYASIQALLQR